MKRRAFTLVELLVVIGLIAALVAILLPSLGRARESARSIGCASGVRQIGMAMLMYAQDNKGTLPTASDLGLVWTPASPGWVAYFYPSTGGTSVEFADGAFMKYLGDMATRARVLRCVEAEEDSANYSYVLPEGLGDPSKPLMLLTRILNPTRKIIVIEMNGVTSRFDGHYSPDETGPDRDQPADHHLKIGITGYGNHAFADGHVESLSRDDVEDTKNLDRFNYTAR